jgi:hypothetical protein
MDGQFGEVTYESAATPDASLTSRRMPGKRAGAMDGPASLKIDTARGFPPGPCSLAEVGQQIFRSTYCPSIT